MKNGKLTNVPNLGAVCDSFFQNGHFDSFFGNHQVQGILIGAVAAFVVIVTILGPEHHGSHFEKSKTAFEQGGGEADPEAFVEDDTPSLENSALDDGNVSEKERA